MRHVLRSRLAAAAVAMCVIGGTAAHPAFAAPITETFDFTATGFSPGGGGTDPWDGSFTLTFNPLAASTGALPSFSSNLPVAYGSFDYVYVPAAGPSVAQLVIGDDCDLATSTCTVSNGSPPPTYVPDTALLNIPLTAPNLPDAGYLFAQYTNASGTTDYATGDVTASVVPEPSSMLLVGAGLLGLGAVRRRRAAA